MTSHRRASSKRVTPRLALAREVGQVCLAWVRHGVFGLPLSLMRAIAQDPSVLSPLGESQLAALIGATCLRLFDDLGPIYGKAGQIALSRLSPPWARVASSLHLTRLYQDWPPLPWREVTVLLDRSIPNWRSHLDVETQPLGVASLAQVHGTRTADGREWVVKVLKPRARRRLLETIEAAEQLVTAFETVAVTALSRRAVRELGDLCRSFRGELSLQRERETIERVRAKLQGRKQVVLRVPAVNGLFCSDDVLVCERFRGVPLADVVTSKTTLSPASRRKLARTMLAELLVQVFELGLFHADPHAGNLILLGDGSVGLFDWGLSGELLDSDRRHIAALLRAVLTLDLERLIDTLVAMGEEGGQTIDRERVRRELKSMMAMVEKGRADGKKRPSLQALLEQALKGAARLGIVVPDGLLLMAKALITIEGLARGIDPDVSLPRIAGPVLWQAARPGLADILAMGRKLPQVARQIFGL